MECMCKKIDIADKAVFDEHFRQCDYGISEFTFTNLFMWRRAYSLMWQERGPVILVTGLWNDEQFMFFPIGRLEDALQAVKELSATRPLQLRSVPKIAAERLALLLPNARITAAEDDFDYVYSVRDLTELAGRRFEKKRHHVNKLLRTYPQIAFSELNAELLPVIIEHADAWYSETLSDDIWLKYERVAIEDVLKNWHALGVEGAALILQNRVVAFTVGERLNDDTAVVHIEKADTNIDGTYQLINREFLRHYWKDLEYVNREEDMGLETLRIAKQSYHPVKMVEKYVVDIA